MNSKDLFGIGQYSLVDRYGTLPEAGGGEGSDEADGHNKDNQRTVIICNRPQDGPVQKFKSNKIRYTFIRIPYAQIYLNKT